MSQPRFAMHAALAAAALAVISPPAGAAPFVVRHGERVFTLSAHGALVSAPAGTETVDGPKVALGPGFEEWFALAYDASGGRREWVGLGGSPDWASRPPLTAVSASSDGTSFVCRVRGGEVEVETRYAFDPAGPHLLVEVAIANRGASVLSGFVYTREWRTGEGEGWTFPGDIRGLRLAPDDVRRRVWMLDDLEPGETSGLRLSYQPPGEPAAAAGPVPLTLWTHADFPAGLPVGETNGISWGDLDADGWIDIFACMSGNLWRNVGGTTFVLAADLDGVLPATGRRYGASFGDYDNDGLADIGTEPRDSFGGDDKLHLLRNLGGASFVDVATDPAIVDVQPFGDSETLAWGDVDGDADLDLFVPVYPTWAGGGAAPGNFFLENLGPTGPGGAYRFTEASAAAGLDNPPPDSARPEGAQLVDVDFDGDMDLYSNGTLYQNVSSPAVPDFDDLTETTSGIGLHDSLDEGALLFDYDLDGDYDLPVVYTRDGVRIWEAYGDGTYFEADQASTIDSPFTGLDLGMSAEDWDLDGDIDFTTRQVFRQNMWMEEGRRHFTVAVDSIPASHQTSATPAWGDFDKDGDLDCALGNWLDVGHFYENTTYDAGTPPATRRHLRVRPVRNSAAVPDGLETEYATSVEVRTLNVGDGLRRRKFTASGHGYINQNEYALTFALPPDPDPGVPDVVFDVAADFPSLPVEGFWRVDRHVNPALGGIDLGTLADREIRVWRCGQVRKDGVLYPPAPAASPLLVTTTGGLALATPSVALPAPVLAPGVGWWVGLAFDTRAALDRIRIKEVILDGQLDLAASCPGGDHNLALWDVTVPASPALVAARIETTSARNRRSWFPVEWVLDPGRDYRLVARVTELRRSVIAGPIDHGAVVVAGGVGFADAAACGGAGAAAATVDAGAVPLAFRFSPSVRGELADPIGNDLRMVKDAAGKAVVHWPAVPTAAGFDVLRCDARGSRPCTPAPHARVAAGPHTDLAVGPLAGEHFWYRLGPYVDCP